MHFFSHSKVSTVLSVLAIFSVSLALFGFPRPGAHAAGPQVSLSPKFGHPSAVVTVSGTAFGSSEMISITFDATSIGTSTTDSTGMFRAKVIVPSSVWPGTHLIQATGKISRLTASASFMVQTNWPLFGFDATHTHFNPYENMLNTSNVASLTVDWSAQSGYVGYSSPMVVNGVVYVGAYDDKLSAYNAATGMPLWNALTADRIDSTPAVMNKTVYVGSDKLYAFNAKTGAVKWTGNTGNMDLGYIESSPVVAEGRVYIGSSNKTLYAFNASGCGSAICSPLWRASTTDAILSTPAVTKSVVYIASGNSLYAFNASTGAILWTASAPSTTHAYSSPMVVNGMVYVCADDSIYAFNATTGASIFMASTRDLVTITSTPAVANGVLVVGSDDEKLYAFNATTGELLWESSTNGRLSSSPAIANGVVYIGSDSDFQLHAFDISTGNALWTSTTGNSIYSSPAVVNGVVYIGSDSVYAFHLPNPTTK